MPIAIAAFVFALGTLIATGAGAGDLNRGVEAFRQGKFDAALAELEPLAKQGDVVAQYHLGEMHLKGSGVPQDFAAARGWYAKAAEGGLADAQAALAGLSLLGLGAERSYEEGYFWAIISVIWSRNDIRAAAMQSLTQVSRMLEPQPKAEIAREAAGAWRR